MMVSLFNFLQCCMNLTRKIPGKRKKHDFLGS